MFAFFSLVCVVVIISVVIYKTNQKLKRKQSSLLESIDNISSSNSREAAFNKLKRSNDNIILDQDFEESLLLFEKQELFLNPKVSLNDLVIELNANRSVVSNYINRSRSKNFNQYINQLRINHILKRLESEPNLRKYTIDALAEEIGFNSRKTFSDAFLEHTGFRPSNYIKKFDF